MPDQKPTAGSGAKMTKTSTPGIYRRGSRYVVVWQHRGRQHKSFHRTLAEAREAKGGRQAGDRHPAERQPFDEYARAWIQRYQGRTRRGFDEDTRESYAAALEAHAIPHFGSTRLRDIEREDVEDLIAKLQQHGLSPSSISKYVAPVRALFSDLVERGKLTANPALALKINAKAARSTGGDGVEKAMTRAELTAVLEAIPERHRLIFGLMAGTGCRISEALGLEWRDLGHGGATLRIERQWYRGKLKRNTKTDAGARTIELPPALGAALWEVGGGATGPMFHTRTGNRLNDRNLRRVLDAAAERAGVAGVSHHTFRHTHGSILLDEGWSIPEVSRRLGHADPQITAKVYSHAMVDRVRPLAFLDETVKGKGWAIEGRATAANAEPSSDSKVTSLQAYREQPQLPAKNARHS